MKKEIPKGDCKQRTETNLHRIRKKKGYTQKLLAKAAGIKQATLSRYERRSLDINKAEVLTVYRMASMLGCLVEDLIELKEEDCNGREQDNGTD